MSNLLANSFVFEASFEKFGETVEVSFDVAKLPRSGQEYLIGYGCKQSISDSYAGAKDAAEFRALIEKRIAAILAGTVSDRGRSDSVTAMRKKVALELFTSAARQNGVKLSKLTDEQRTQGLAEFIEIASEAINAEADRRLAKKKEMAGTEAAASVFAAFKASVDDDESEDDDE